jgi:hypothetical protein
MKDSTTTSKGDPSCHDNAFNKGIDTKGYDIAECASSPLMDIGVFNDNLIK